MYRNFTKNAHRGIHRPIHREIDCIQPVRSTSEPEDRFIVPEAHCVHSAEPNATALLQLSP